MASQASPSPFFVKNVGALTPATAQERRAAVVALAGLSHDADDFHMLVEALGLQDAVQAAHEARRAA